ncbi:SCO2102 family sporulation regulator [Streptomyces cellulosae]|uniref:SCO2102 family sporulation regulator n=1 Tax=Streptomyces cellulosae TaxID=1968 RepID=UPI0004C61C73|nr:membrane protein [Streptomyces cellulosae]
MGWTVLYIAFGVVALWLLGEVLLQYKARLRWRLLAFAGFLGVVFGVLLPSVIVIGLGAIAFAVGQTFVTLSFRRGFAAGWAVSRPGADGVKRRRGKADHQDPTLEVTDLEAGDAGYGGDADHRQHAGAYGHDDEYDRDDVFAPARPVGATAAESTAVYEPQPLPDDTGSYGVYNSGYAAAEASYAHSGQQTQDQYATAAADPSYSYDGYTGYDQQQYGYDAAGQQQYAAYSDPYIGTQTYGGAGYDASYGDQQQYGQQGYGQDQYGTGTYGDTPGGGVWVPQQRSTDDPYGDLPPEQQQYGQQGYDQNQNQGNGFDEQYRF